MRILTKNSQNNKRYKMNDSDYSDLETVIASPTRAYNRFSLFQEKAENGKGIIGHAVEAETRAKMFQKSDFLLNNANGLSLNGGGIFWIHTKIWSLNFKLQYFLNFSSPTNDF